MTPDVAKESPELIRPLAASRHGLNLFLVGFLVLFMELAFIRWFAANVIFLQFFTNVVLLACFLGMSCGCLASRSRQNWLVAFPLLALLTVSAALAMSAIYTAWIGLTVDVGGQASPQVVFFGTEYRDPDVAQFTVPIEAVVAIFFVLIALSFVGLGQVLGRAFASYPDRIEGYTLNIGGSLAGIGCFSVLSLLQTPPAVWFTVFCSGIGYLLYQSGWLKAVRTLALIALPMIAMLPPILSTRDTYWSPYYSVEYDKAIGHVMVDNIGHQFVVPFSNGGSTYSLIHLLQRGSGGAAFDDVMIIGAGTGNDVTHALRLGVRHVDAVEIDPVIQSIGASSNPDGPYQDTRVVPHVDDGRHFLRTTQRKYDLVVYALVDSLVLHSGYANIRLESYLFTQQAFDDIARVLKPGGTFVSYNYFRQGWIVERVAAMAEASFGCKPIVLTLPYQTELKSSQQAGYAVIIGGCNPRLREAFANEQTFWLNRLPARNLEVNGFEFEPETLSEQPDDWQKIAPASIVHDRGEPILASDDWPFLYLQSRLIPDVNVRSMLLLGGLGIGMVLLFVPKQRGGAWIDGRMFFLGAAFMLLETKAVVQLALLFGSTWLVNSLVFSTVLVLILLSNLYVLKARTGRLAWYYAGLFVFLALGVLTSLDAFLDGALIWRYAVPSIVALGPMFFAGVIFAKAFGDSPNPDAAFGSNIAGAVVGGLCESFSMLLGFRYLLLLAALFYLLSLWPSLPWKRLAGH